MLSGLQILPQNKTTQIFVVLPFTTFSCDFLKNFLENLNNFFLQNLKFPTLLLVTVRLLSGIANLVLKCE